MRVPRQDAAPRYLTVSSEDAVQRYTGIQPLTTQPMLTRHRPWYNLTSQIYHETCGLSDDGTGDSYIHGQEELGVAAAHARRVPNGKPD